ncbi:hypothetical protein DK894_22910 [Escherichia coli]|nr:hypothetical protein [Escherichia coli]DAH02866.1 MAG TPA: hypothetical protein [Bacteriophage sp.]EEV7812943.1 hypothetical protein [Escherichia coli]EEY7534816.1 hypothetical protein [Escherichia coli]EEY8845520.1 hypothetical protein [Escherichia coli]
MILHATWVARSSRVPPQLARIQSGHATALKPPHKAGRRGGDSIARQSNTIHNCFAPCITYS